MLKSGADQDPLVALEEEVKEEIKEVKEEIKEVKANIKKAKAQYSEEDLSKNALYTVEVSRLVPLESQLAALVAHLNHLHARREKLETQAGVGGHSSSIDMLVKTVQEMAIDQKRVNFAMKLMTDSLPPNIGVVVPSEDCKTDKSGKYRALMHALRMNEEDNVMSLATPIDHQECGVAEFSFNWKDKDERESYKPLQEYLKKEFKMNAAILADGEGLPGRNLFVSNIFTLRPKLGDLTRDLKKAALGQEPQFRFRIQGRTDLGIFKEGGVMGCGDLLIAIEVKPKSKFASSADINRALREGVLQLVGTNADNHYTSPIVIVTALVGVEPHYLLYLDLGPDPHMELRYHLRVRRSASLSQLIHFAQTLCGRGCISSRFAAPPTPTNSPSHNSPEKGEKEEDDEEEDDEDFDADNVTIESA